MAITKVLDRQPRRDRRPHRPRLQGRRHRLRRRLRRPRPRRPARQGRRRGVRPRRLDPRRDLPGPGQDPRRSPTQAGADAVHPGYGFLAENAELRPGRHRRRADLDRPLARGHRRASATRSRPATSPTAPTPRSCPAPRTRSRTPTRSSRSPRSTALPVAIKAAYGGGGRGLKVARTLEEIPELFESAVREAVTAFGRGECFVERYLDKPRHVETQCLADQHGNVVVVSHPRLLAAAPPPEARRGGPRAVPDRRAERRARSARRKAILKEAGYVGAGTCEFLVGQDGTISLPRGQHPPAGRAPGHRGGHRHRPGPRAVPHRRRRGARATTTDPAPRGHSFEFRINGEDPGRGFLPAPGTVTDVPAADGPRRARRLRRRAGRRHLRPVRLDARQAHRHRRRPPAGAGALPPRAGRVRGRGHADGR